MNSLAVARGTLGVIRLDRAGGREHARAHDVRVADLESVIGFAIGTGATLRLLADEGNANERVARPAQR